MPRPRKDAPSEQYGEADSRTAVVETSKNPEPVSVTVEIPESHEEPLQKYFMGVIKTCPYAVLHVSGQDFPKETQNVEPGDTLMETTRIPQPGKFASLSQSRVEMICRDVVKKVIRMGPKSAQILCVDGKGYRASPDDVPLAKFIYLMRMPQDVALDPNGIQIQTMA